MRTFALFLTSFFIYLSPAFTGDSPAFAIVNGEEVEAQSSIQYLEVQILTPRLKRNPNDPNEKTKYSGCTGALIADDLVLTAAHCAASYDTSMPIIAVFERITTAAWPKLVHILVSTINLHPNYKPLLSGDVNINGFYQDVNDVAIMKLTEIAPAKYVRMRLAPDWLSTSNGVEMVAIGYGRVTGLRNRPGESGVLRINRELKTNPYFEQSSYFIVDQRSGGQCEGDSGGPAMHVADDDRIYAIGVASVNSFSDRAVNAGGDPCLAKSIYSNVGFYRRWIIETAQSYGSSIKISPPNLRQ